MAVIQNLRAARDWDGTLNPEITRDRRSVPSSRRTPLMAGQKRSGVFSALCRRRPH